MDWSANWPSRISFQTTSHSNHCFWHHYWQIEYVWVYQQDCEVSKKQFVQLLCQLWSYKSVLWCNFQPFLTWSSERAWYLTIDGKIKWLEFAMELREFQTSRFEACHQMRLEKIKYWNFFCEIDEKKIPKIWFKHISSS